MRFRVLVNANSLSDSLPSYKYLKMNIEKYLIERDLEHIEREIGSLFKAGTGLIVLDIILMLTKIAKPGRWFYQLIGNWIYPIVIGIGGFGFLFAVYYLYKLSLYYRTAPEYKSRISPTLFKALVYAFAFIVFFLFVVVSNIRIPEYYFPTDWV